jgi:hypothetical protein
MRENEAKKGAIVAVMGWSLPYTLGVLGGWKMAAVCCQAVLCHGQRIGLDGAPAEAVDAEAKHLAAKQLAQLATRKVDKKAVEAAAPAVVKPKAASGTANRDAGHGPRADLSWHRLWGPFRRLAGQAAIWQSSVSLVRRFRAMFERPVSPRSVGPVR